jgi:hypothetical protein
MATTTNYGWTTPDDTALVKDGAAAIRTLGTSVDTTTKNLNPSTTLGDIEYRSSSANVNTRLAIGSTGNILTVAGGVPTWAPPAGGGKVLQVINATYSTQTNSSSTTFADTGLTATITPTSATSTILVFANIAGIIKTDQNTSTGGIYNLMRGATQIVADFGGVAGFNNVSQFNYVGGAALTYRDSPATTSATTYKVQFKNNAALNQIGVQGNSASSSITLMEIGA